MARFYFLIRILSLTVFFCVGSAAHSNDQTPALPTGADLLKFCTSQETFSQMSCGFYIAGFVHGMKHGKGLQQEICLPELLTPAEAEAVFVRTLREMEKAAKDGSGAPTTQNPFFTETEDAALAAALGLNFPCKK